MAEKLLDRIKHSKLPVSSVPIALFLICFMAFGLMAPFLGFYGDEWNIVFDYVSRGARGLAEYLYYDGHPTVTWSYIASFQLLGANPVAWQFYSLIWRWLAVLAFWLVLRQLWPERRLEAFMAAVVFALYPQFTMQSQAVSYFEVWLSYFLLFMSFWFNVKAIQQADKRVLFLVISILFKIGHLFTSEYTWGVELIRPLLLWFALSGPLVIPEKLKKILAVYWPHLLLSAGLFVWRIFFYQSPIATRAQPRLLSSLLQSPWLTLQQTFSSLLQDVVLMLFSAWQKLVQPGLFDLSLRSNLLEIGLVVAVALACWWYLSHLDADENHDTAWLVPALWVGGAALLFGLIPFYVAGYSAHAGDEPYNGRFVLGSLPGIAVLTALALAFFVGSKAKRILLFAILAGLMVGWQFNAANQFRQLWTTQEQFYRQLLWRAPVIAPGTALISDEVLPQLYMSRSVVFALNTLYAQAAQDNERLDYWFFEFSGTTLTGWKLKVPGEAGFAPFVAGVDLPDQKYTTTFLGNSRQSLYLSYRPDLNRCLWLITVDQAGSISDQISLKPLAEINAFSRISSAPANSPTMLTQIFGTGQPADKNWCYFFEKADLAGQSGDWQSVRDLWSAAQANSVQPADGIEYFPFMEAYARAGNWSTALKLGRAARRTTRNLGPALCAFWSRLTSAMPASAQNLRDLKRTGAALGCQS